MLSEASFCTIGMLHHLNARKKEIVSPKAQVAETAMGRPPTLINLAKYHAAETKGRCRSRAVLYLS